ncbi:MAG: PilZ domain-containing protein [Candidatus Omnitrophica bacterium]|nr:PilZ domain-containing protein [Candidatus Omnitrophota bacterium]MDD5592573.1 PilZ domain-containing protein [Candidatus Omnitrophota bacterium]
MQERRVFARIKIKIPLKFLKSGSDTAKEAEAVDISATGIGFITKENIAVKTPLDIWINLPDHHGPIHLTGRVVWSKDLGENGLKRVGIQLGKEKLMELGRVWLFQETRSQANKPSIQ